MPPVDNFDADSRRDLILAAAYYYAPHQETIYANCARVLRRALLAGGLWDDSFAIGLHDQFECPIVERWYSALIELTQHEPELVRLLQGGGNLGDPASNRPAAAPHFTACWLTPAGVTHAERVLVERPDWRARLSPPAK